MNVHPRDLDTPQDRDEAADLLARLRAWVETAAPEEVRDLDPVLSAMLDGDQGYPALKRAYPEDFTVDDAYRAQMPDLQNGPSSLIRGPSARSSTSVSLTSACRSATTPATTAI